MNENVEKAEHLIRMALDARTPDKERVSAAMRACEIIAKYGLLSGTPSAVAGAATTVASFIDRVTSPEFIGGVIGRAEKFAEGVERIGAAAKKVKQAAPPREDRPRRRRYR